MKCSKCGAELKEGQKFCMECGTQVVFSVCKIVDEQKKATENCEGSKDYEMPTSNVDLGNDTFDVVDLGLSVKWASCNLGATRPEEPGSKYKWGETQVSYEALDDGNYKWRDRIGGFLFKSYVYNKYNTGTVKGLVDNKTILDAEDDAATVVSGGVLRIPTKEEWAELMERCSWTSFKLNGTKGLKVQSKMRGYEDKWIFLPVPSGIDKYGCYYWSSSLHIKDSSAAWMLSFLSVDVNPYKYHDLKQGARTSPHCIRPVMK